MFMELPWLRHLFTPHYTNNHRARILHPSVLTLLLLLFLFYQVSLNFFLKSTPSVLGYASSINVEKIIELTNQKRAERGLAPLTENSILDDAANKKAADMFANNYWAHTSPTGKEPWAFFKEVGYQYTFAGENLARDFMNSSEVVDAWMNSPSHRDNVVNTNYKEIGVAVVNGTINGSQTTLVVQLFGTPSNSAQAAKKPTVSPKAIAEVPRVVEQNSSQSASSPAILQQQPVNNQPIVINASTDDKWPMISPFWLTKAIAVFLLALVLGALIIDLIFVYQYRIVRLSSRNLSHLLFLAVLLIAIIFTTPGAIF